MAAPVLDASLSLARWVRPFARDVRAEARHAFYPAVAELTARWVELDLQAKRRALRPVSLPTAAGRSGA